jgi:ADP-ribose pyrophosphatase
MPPLPWKTLTTREVYRNPWLRLREDIAEMPNGKTTLYSVCEMGECVGILPFIDDTHVIMVRQYRYVQQEAERWEIPTGGAHVGEPMEQAAQRELAEEIGYRAGRLQHINTNYTSKSVCAETAHLYIAYDLTPATAPPDDTEFLEVVHMPFSEALERVLNGDIRDAMSIIAILWAARTSQQQRD